jgi:hypothetical protein
MVDFANPQIDFEAVNRHILPRFGTMVMDLLPGGVIKGREYEVRNPTRDDRKSGSFKINYETGVWKDFATRDAGSDPISLYAYVKGVGQVEAAKRLIEKYKITEHIWSAKEPENEQTKTLPQKGEWVLELQEKDAETPLPQEIPGLGSWTSSWPYRDEQGRLLFWVARVDLQDGKKIRPVTWCRNRSTGETTWRLMAPPPPLPLYRLNDLISNPDRPVLVVEGEKAAEAAQKLFPGMDVVTSSGGSNAAHKTDWGPLKGRDVLISPDLDEPGEKYLLTAAEKAKAAGAESVKRLDWPAHRIIVEGKPANREGNPPKGHDLADAVTEGWTAELVQEAMNQGEIKVTEVTPVDEETDEPPNPLFRPLPKAPEYPAEALGPVLAKAVRAIHKLTQAPEAICCQSVLAVAALATQGHADVETPHKTRKPFSLYLLSIAESGDRKSSADSYALTPVKEYEADLKKQHALELETFRAEYAAWESQKKQVLNKKHPDGKAKAQALMDLGPAPQPPLLPMLLCAEPTWEGLTSLLKDGQPSQGLFSSEGGQFIGGHAMNKDNRLKTVAAMSSLWDGNPISRVRKSEQASVLAGRRFALHLMVQPKVANHLLADSDLEDQGVLSRLLIVAPDSPVGTRTYTEPDPLDLQAVEEFKEAMLAIFNHPLPLAEGQRNELEPRPLPLSEEAKSEYAAFVNKIEKRMASNGGDLYEVRGLVNKMPEQALRMAGVLTLVRDMEATEIGQEELHHGVELAEFYTAEALRLYSAGVIDPDLLLAEQVMEWVLNIWGQPLISLPDLYQRGPKAIRDRKMAKGIMTILEEHGHLRRIEGGAVVDGKRRREVYEVISK